ncbi:MAG: DnaJ domain-containing protein [Alphaproteobacteria bacterium]|nr:DnaJ domain-containing protein [Alphaproteobacteria bacterium]
MSRTQKTRSCDHPNCKADGTCRAPKSRKLDDYYWFCQKHAAEYNKSWNYYDGLSFEEIEAETRADETWRTQTFKFGLNLKSALKDGRIDDPHGVFEKLFKASMRPTKKSIVLSAKHTAAIELLGLSYPFTEAALKSAYKKHAKIHHPDLNRGSKKSEEKFKQISAAFATLKILITKK